MSVNLQESLTLMMMKTILWSSDTVMEFNIGLMELIMRDSGILTKLKEKVHFGMLKEMFTEENSEMIWLMGMENILTLMEANIKESLKTMCRRAMERKNGLMVLNMSAPIKME